MAILLASRAHSSNIESDRIGSYRMIMDAVDDDCCKQISVRSYQGLHGTKQQQQQQGHRLCATLPF